jgi:pilus assembly protein Flp/PilA
MLRYRQRVAAISSHKRGDIIMLDRLFGRSRGQGLVEYALIIALVAIVVIATLILLGPQIASIFKNISNNL